MCGLPRIEKKVKKFDVLSSFQAINRITAFIGNTENFLHILVTTITGLKLSRAVTPGISLRLDMFRCALQVPQHLKMFEITFASILLNLTGLIIGRGN